MYGDAYNSDREAQLAEMLAAGQLQQALELLDAWYVSEPWNSEVLMRRAVVHWLAGEPARTLRDLDAYLTIDPENAEALSRRAQALLMLGKREDAEATLAKAEAIDPTTPGVLLNRALLHEEHGDFVQALGALSAYLEQVPSDHLALARRSHLQRSIGNYRQALIDAQTSVAMHPEDPETHFAEALAHVALEEGDEALRSCDVGLQARPAFLPALRLKIDLLADLGRGVEAEAHLDRLRAVDAENPQTTLLEARVAVERGDFTGALARMSQYLDNAPDDPHGYYRRGMVYYRMRDFDRALADFQHYSELAPTAIEGYEQQFMCHLERNALEDAIHIGLVAARRQPESYRLQYNLAFAQLLHGDLAQALDGFELAVSLEPENNDLLLRVYMAFAEHAPLQERITLFRRLVGHVHPSSAMMRGLLAESLLEAGQADEALALARDLLQEEAPRSFAYLLAIKAFCVQDRYDEALTLADTAVRALPADGQLRLARALLLRDTGHPEAALQELDLAEALLPGDAEVFRQRGLVYGSIGQIDLAVSLMRQAVATDATNPDSYFWLGYFLIHQRNYREAMSAADVLLTMEGDSAEGHLLRGVALRGLRRPVEAQADLDAADRMDPALLHRLRQDPVIAGLLTDNARAGVGGRLRQSASRYWQGLRRTLRHESP